MSWDAFTLIELLVVIAIIATVKGVSQSNGTFTRILTNTVAADQWPEGGGITYMASCRQRSGLQTSPLSLT